MSTMQSPTQSSEPSSPGASLQHHGGAPARAGAGSRPNPDVVGVDGIKIFFEELRSTLKSSCEDAELDGVSTFLPSTIQRFVERVLGQFGAKKLCVVFDGLFLPMALKEQKELTEDIVMAMAVIFLKLEQEVMFAPYLASSQLESLKNEGHIQAVYRSQPIRVPPEFVSWNESDVGPRQPNIYKHILNLATYSDPSYPGISSVYLLNLDRSGTSPDSASKFLDKFSSVDEPYVAGPPLLFLLQSAGIISPRLARAVANRVVESDGVDREVQTALYEFMGILLPLRAQIVHQLITHIPTNPMSSEINLRWDENSNSATPPIIALDNWAISNLIQGRNGPQNKDHLHFVEPWGITDVLQFEHCAISTNKYEEVTIQTLIPTVILRALDLMGYFTHAQDDDGNNNNGNGDSSCSIYGEALKQFHDTPELSEAAVLFIELVRTSAFSLFRNVFINKDIANTGTTFDDMSEYDKNIRAAKDVAAKIATLIPCASYFDPKITTEKKYDVEAHSEFIKAAQAHARSLRMLLEASAGNVILREFINLAVYNAPDYVPHPYSLAGATNVLPTITAALPFGAHPPSARSFFVFCALRDYKTPEAIAAEFGAPLAHVQSDVQNMRNFVQGLLNARNHLSVRDDDVGLDPITLDVIEPAIEYLCEVVGVEYTEPVSLTEEFQ